MAKLHAVTAVAAAVAAAGAGECDLSASWAEVPAVVRMCQSIMIKILVRTVWCAQDKVTQSEVTAFLAKYEHALANCWRDRLYAHNTSALAVHTLLLMSDGVKQMC